MSDGAFRNFIFSIISVFLSIGIGLLGFNYPSAIARVTEIVITSLSIIFGLSLALIALASSETFISESKYPKEKLRHDLQTDLSNENSRVLTRQVYSIVVFVIAIVFGVAFLGFYEVNSNSAHSRKLSAIFCFFFSLSFTIALTIPFTISKITKRNSFLR